MRYRLSGEVICLGDCVVVEGDVSGVVVCDYDLQKCLAGYEKWLSNEELVGGGRLSKGVMIETKELGFLYYANEDEGIRRSR